MTSQDETLASDSLDLMGCIALTGLVLMVIVSIVLVIVGQKSIGEIAFAFGSLLAVPSSIISMWIPLKGIHVPQRPNTIINLSR